VTQTFKTLLALLKKNNSQPGVLTSIWVMLAMAVFGAFDASRPLSPPAWFGMLLWVVILGTSAGTGAFSADLTSNHLRFLEYLPIRRWQIWLADWGDGLVWLLAMLLLAVGPRTLNWTPPPEGGRGPEEAFNAVFFPTRWSAMVGLTSLGFCTFGIGAFYRVLVERDSVMVFRAIISSLAVCAAVWAVPGLLRIVPTLLDVAVPLFVLGALFSAGSYLLFAWTPKEWGVFRRWALLRLPCVLTIYGTGAVVLFLCCRQWTALDLARPARVGVAAVNGEPAESLLVTVRALRSGPHLLSLDPRTGRHHYLGRGLSPYRRGGSSPSGPDGRLLLRAEFAPDGFWPAAAIVGMNPDGTGRRTLLDLPNERDEGSVSEVAWSPDGSSLIFATTARNGAERMLCIADPSGAVRRRIPIDGRGNFALHGNDLLTVPHLGRRPDEEREAVRSLLHVDLESNRQRTIELPGYLLGCSTDLRGAVCLKNRDGDGVRRRSLVWVDLRTAGETVVAHEDEIPPLDLHDVEPREYGSVDGGELVYPAPRRGWSDRVGMSFGDVHAFLDDAGRRIAWFVHGSDRSSVTPAAVTLVDPETGKRRPLLDASSAAASRPAPVPAGSRQPLSLHGFTRRGDELVYEWGNEVVAVSTADGVRRVVARRPAGADHVTWTFSPDGRRVTSRVSTYDRDASPPTQRSTVQAWHDGRAVTLFDGVGNVSPQWLDDEHVILEDEFTLTLVPARGEGPRRLLFATGSKHHHAAGTAPK
jgi:dipeptidyl aminopeptidase/acylaminoacyl peptidase